MRTIAILVLMAATLPVACGSSDGGAARDTAGADARAEAGPDAAADLPPVDKDVAAEDAAAELPLEATSEPQPEPPFVESRPDEPSEPVPEVVEEAVADTGGELPCPVAGAVFEPANPGVNVLFAITAFGMMGMDQDMGLGLFLPAAREDFVVAKPNELPLDTCVLGAGVPVTPGCATDADCAPEQKCTPEKDNPSNLQCITPRQPLDVGPFTATGFKSGPRTFTYNAQQSGGYTSTPDGSIPASELVFDQTYVAEGAGDPAKGLGAFRASLYVPAQLKLLDPPSTPGQFGTAEIAVDTTADLTLTWSTGTDGGTLDISLASTGGAALTCHAANDGSFTVPADLLSQVNLGAQSFFNMLTLTRETPGQVCGEGVTVGVAKFATVVLLNVKKVQ
jgi:hypothetical protein